MLNSLLAIGLLQVSLSGAGQVPLTPLEYATPADARLFSYNTVLGPILQIPYDNKGLIAGIEALGLGSVRYPGGTVADYWSMAKGNYIDHCEQSLCSCCYFQPNISSFPDGTFSPEAVLAPDSLGRATTATPIFDVNVLTFNESAALADLDSLAKQVDSTDDVELFELGNEFYLPNYRWRFPNASTYMEASAPVVSKGRELFPDALVLAVAWESHLHNTDCGDDWNSQVAASRHLYDGVTLHDYSIGNGSVTKKYQPDEYATVVASWSSAQVRASIQGVNSCFGNDTLIAYTEYNYVGGTGTGYGPYPHSPLLYPYGAIHGMFQAGRILEAPYHTTSTPTPPRMRRAAAALGGLSTDAAEIRWSRYVSMHMHALAEDTAVGWDAHSGVLQFNASLGPDAPPMVSGVGQLFAHLTRAARPAPWSAFEQMKDGASGGSAKGAAGSISASYFVPLAQPSGGPVVPVDLRGETGLPCLQGSLFVEDPSRRASPRFAVINRCNQNITVSLPAFDPKEASAWIYSAEDEGGWAPLPPKGAPAPWASGPLHPASASVDCGSSGCSIEMQGVSMVISAGA